MNILEKEGKDKKRDKNEERMKERKKQENTRIIRRKLNNDRSKTSWSSHY